jgi:aspartate aminotransferase
MRAEYGLRRETLLGALAGIPGVRTFAPRGAFYVWAEVDADLFERVGVASADELSARLAQNGIGSAPGDAFGEHCHNAIRFAFSCETNMVKTGAELLRAALLGEESL